MNTGGIIPTYAFLDEQGNLNKNSPQRYFSVGALISSYPDNLIDELHLVFEGLCSLLKKDSSRLEFHFKELTNTSVDQYIIALDVLQKHKSSWRFCMIVIDREDPKFRSPGNKLEEWEAYLRFIKMLLKSNLRNNEQVILLTDYRRRPKGKVRHLATLPQVVSNLTDTLKIESQGTLLVQMTDLLIGGELYAGSIEAKNKLKGKVEEIKKVVGKKGFDRWDVTWR